MFKKSAGPAAVAGTAGSRTTTEPHRHATALARGRAPDVAAVAAALPLIGNQAFVQRQPVGPVRPQPSSWLPYLLLDSAQEQEAVAWYAANRRQWPAAFVAQVRQALIAAGERLPAGSDQADGKASQFLAATLLRTGLAADEALVALAAAAPRPTPPDVMVTYDRMLADVADAVDAVLARSGVPPLTWMLTRTAVPRDADPATKVFRSAQFWMAEWTLRLDVSPQRLFDPEATPQERDARMAGFLAALAVEARRAEQHFAAAWYAASQGHPAGDIQTTLLIPGRIAALAVERARFAPLVAGTADYAFGAGCYAELTGASSMASLMILQTNQRRMHAELLDKIAKYRDTPADHQIARSYQDDLRQIPLEADAAGVGQQVRTVHYRLTDEPDDGPR